MLCVGLDPDPARFPGSWQGRPEATFEFCRDIVDATADTVCAFKPQIAYFAAHRAEDALERLIALDAAQPILARDVAAVDLRLPARPVLRLAPYALAEMRRARGILPPETDL
jgi:hypothetical protein